MNRAERRRLARQGIKAEKEPTVQMKKADISQMKQSATEDAVKKAFFLMMAIPVMVIHDKYPQLMKREVDGKSREERFCDFCIDLYDSFEKDYITFEELADCLWEEAGIKIDSEGIKYCGK